MSKELEYKIRGGILLYEIKKVKNEKYITINGFKEDFESKNLNIPAEIDGIKVKEIGINAFCCVEISSLTLPEGLVVIKESAFDCCDELKKVVFPTSLRVIEDEAFSGCNSLTTVKFNEGLEYIEDSAFSYTNIQKLVLPNSLIEIGESAFECCDFESIAFGSKLKIIGERAFADNPALKNIKFNEGLEKIGDEAFFECGVESVILPDSLSSMSFDAFNGCTCLKNFHIGKNFTNNDYVTTLLFNCPELEKITISPSNRQFKVIDGFLYDMNIKELVRTPSNIKKLTIPKWVESVSPDCFFEVYPDRVIIKAESIENIYDSCLDDIESIICVPGSEVEEWALDRGIKVKPYVSLLNDFVESLTDEGLEIND